MSRSCGIYYTKDFIQLNLKCVWVLKGSVVITGTEGSKNWMGCRRKVSGRGGEEMRVTLQLTGADSVPGTFVIGMCYKFGL